MKRAGTKKVFKNPNKVSRTKELVANILSSGTLSANKIGYFISMAGDITEFDRFCRSELKASTKVKCREIIFDEIIANISGPATILEFGVAHGYTTDYFLSKTKKDIKYYGFDLFTGLPSNWRNLKAGHFSNEGVAPSINDVRLQWVIGDVSESFGVHFPIDSDRKLVVLFDLDLLEPTLHVFNLLKSRNLFKKGTIVYFDEAFDSDELFVLKKLFIENYGYKVLARTWSSIALEVT